MGVLSNFFLHPIKMHSKATEMKSLVSNVVGLKPATLLKVSGVLLWILQHFLEQVFTKNFEITAAQNF